MTTYAIGDVQGCYDPLMRLLEKIQFDPNTDVLWFTGDLVNRGPHSLETLRFVKSLGKKAITVLGNHDLTLLAVAYDATPYNPHHHTFQDVLNAEDSNELIQWLRQCPLLHHDTDLQFTLVHAGLLPTWDLALAMALAREVERVLQAEDPKQFLIHMYGNEPSRWDPHLQGYDRLRFILNCFTRIRFCTVDGTLDLHTKDSAHADTEEYLPWFAIPERVNKNLAIIFGHWASLEGKCNTPSVFPLDTGCVWGNCLTGMRLPDKKRFEVPCAH